MSIIEEINYFNDSRNCTPKGIPTVYVEVEENGEIWDEPHELPWKWDVCPVCDGKGTHVNPSIDSGGLSDEMQGDPDFMEDYFRGTYDQPCNNCHGRSTVQVVDEARCTQDELDAWEADMRAEDEMRAEHLAELRMGA